MEFKGVFVWNINATEQRYISERTENKIEKGYIFPLCVFTNSLKNQHEISSGYAIFKSKATRMREIKDFPFKINGQVPQEYDMIASPPVLFFDEYNREIRDFPIVWLKTKFMGHDVFLLNDLFREDVAKATLSDGTKNYGWLPFCEDIEQHFDANGYYDLNDIQSWELFNIPQSENGTEE